MDNPDAVRAAPAVQFSHDLDETKAESAAELPEAIEETPTLSWETIRQWPKRPTPTQTLAVRRLVAKYKQRVPSSDEYEHLCRSETSNGTFEGEHSARATCGVTTTAAGKSIAMQSVDQFYFGVVQDGIDFIYEGQLDVNVPHGYGVGSFANGERFIGVWADGTPAGLGRRMAKDCQHGWFYGMTAVYLHQERPVVVALPPRSKEQPHLDLYLVGERLETARLKRFRQVFDRWLAVVCSEAEATAIECRTVAFSAWANGCKAQLASVRHEGMRLQRNDQNQQLVAKVRAFVAQEAAATEKNELRQARLRHATLVNTTTVACLGIERRSAELLQQDLAAIESELTTAKAAERRCLALQREYSEIRRRIHEGKVELNALRQARRAPNAVRKPSIMPRRQRRSSAKIYVQEADEDAISNVCGIDGCNCHIAKDIFHPNGDPD
ncbi:hypothetical protein AeNC1_000628 [Aphanomyces euteiches]|nr:hypothetical protein AeNC1_000628 [Aphanomyces euteiches]